MRKERKKDFKLLFVFFIIRSVLSENINNMKNQSSISSRKERKELKSKFDSVLYLSNKLPQMPPATFVLFLYHSEKGKHKYTLVFIHSL